MPTPQQQIKYLVMSHSSMFLVLDRRTDLSLYYGLLNVPQVTTNGYTGCDAWLRPSLQGTEAGPQNIRYQQGSSSLGTSTELSYSFS